MQNMGGDEYRYREHYNSKSKVYILAGVKACVNIFHGIKP